MIELPEARNFPKLRSKSWRDQDKLIVYDTRPEKLKSIGYVYYIGYKIGMMLYDKREQRSQNAVLQKGLLK